MIWRGATRAARGAPLALLALCCVSVSIPAMAASNPASAGDCAAIRDALRLAYEADDWPTTERRAREELERCPDPDAVPVNRAATYRKLLLALVVQDRHAEALKTAEACIATYYRSPTCHMFRGLELTELHRTDEGRAELIAAINVSREILAEKPMPHPNPEYAAWLGEAKSEADDVLNHLRGVVKPAE